MIIQRDVPYHDERELPTFSLRQIDLPDILKWQVNGKYYLVMKVEMTGIYNMKGLPSPDDQPKMEADFKMLSVRPVGDQPVDASTIERKEFDNLVARVKSGDI
jgi:hypothetical protein